MGDSPSQAGSRSKGSGKSVLGPKGESRHDANGDHRQSTLSGLPSARLPQLHRDGSQESSAVQQRDRGGSRGVPPGEELSTRVARCLRARKRATLFLLLPASVEPLDEDELGVGRIGFRHVLYYVGWFVMLRGIPPVPILRLWFGKGNCLDASPSDQHQRRPWDP